MTPGILAYIPPPHWGNSGVFLENIRKFKASTPLYCFSEYHYPDAIPIQTPEILKQARFSNGKVNPYAVNNLVFLTACRIAMSKGLTHMLYLESDCRVNGDNWDGRVWQEFAQLSGHKICAGTVVCYNPCNGGLEFARRWNDLIVNTNRQRLFPLSTYGFTHAGACAGASVFVNGALGVYDLEWMTKIFDLSNPKTTAQFSTAWDFNIGLKLFSLIGLDVFAKVGLLNSVYSGYGDILTSEAQRMELLSSGKVAAVHQVKSSATV